MRVLPEKIKQLRRECELFNIDTSKAVPTRVKRARPDGAPDTVVRVVHEAPAVVGIEKHLPDGMDLARDCWSMDAAMQYALWVCLHAQKAERVLVRQALGSTLDLHTMQCTPLTAEELDRYRDEMEYRRRSKELRSQLTELQRRKEDKAKADAAEKAFRDELGLAEENAVPSPAVQQEQAAQAARTATRRQQDNRRLSDRIANMTSAGAAPATAVQEAQHHE